MKSAIAVLSIGMMIAGVGDAQAQVRGRAKQASSAGDVRHYQWEDAQGRVHFSDTVPEDALRQGHTVYRNGQMVKRVERTLTPEELAVRERDEQELLAQRVLEKQQQEAQALLEQSYPDAASVKADFAQRKVFLGDRITASEAVIAQHRRVLLDRLKQAAGLELEGKKVPAKMAKTIQDTATLVREHQASIELTKQQIAQLNAEEAQVLRSLGW